MPWVIHPCTAHEEVVDTAALRRTNVGQLCEAPGSPSTNRDSGNDCEGKYSLFHCWPMAHTRGTVWKHTAKKIGWKAKLLRREKVIVNSIKVSADWNGREATGFEMGWEAYGDREHYGSDMLSVWGDKRPGIRVTQTHKAFISIFVRTFISLMYYPAP